jgi:hypothetical protein
MRKVMKIGAILRAVGMLLLFGWALSLAAAAPGIWSPAASLIQARFNHTATLLPHGNVLVTGGVGHLGLVVGDPTIVLASAELYDPMHDKWSSAGNMSTERQGHTAILLRTGNVLVVGGSDSSGAVTASADLYNPTTNTWSPAPSMSTARAFHTSTALGDGKVLVAGGKNGSGAAVGSVEIYDPIANTWSSVASLNDARSNHTATRLGNGFILTEGGLTQTTVLASAELYDPAQDRWTPAGSLNSARTDHRATLLSSGKVLVEGGTSSSFNFLDSGELYDPGSNTWSFTSNMVEVAARHTATLLRNGTVLVVSGATPGPYAGDQVYDTSTNVWSGADAGGTPPLRERHTATLLNNGKVLVAGGLNLISALRSAELFSLPTTQTGQAQTLSVNEKNLSALATFESTDTSGCILTDVFVTGGTGTSLSPPTPAPPPSASTGAAVAISQVNACQEFQPLLFALGGTNTANFQANTQLTFATLATTVPMDNLIAGTVFSVTVNLAWTGIGGLIRENGGSGFGFPGFAVSTHFVSTMRLAQSVGVVSDGITNFTPAPSLNQPFCPECNSIQSSKGGAVQVQVQ